MLLKKILDVFCYIILPLALITLSALLPEREVFNYFGWAAVALLVFILFIKPLGKVFSIPWMQRWIAYRRQLGVASFWLAFFHSVMFLYSYDLYTFREFTGWDNYLLYGFFATIGMIILGITSNTYSVLLFKKNWKRIQYLAYPVLILTLLHIAFFRDMLVWATLLIVLYIALKYLERKNIIFISPKKL